MSLGLLVPSLLNPPVLFFFLGIAAALARSDLDVPQPLPKLFSLYLLLSIGFRGGAELRRAGVSGPLARTFVAAVLISLLFPLVSFLVLRRRLAVPDAAAVAATYGSVSAVTFLTAASLLGQLGLPSSGPMVAILALMESPAILVGVALARLAGPRTGERGFSWGELLRDAFLNGSVFVLVGSLMIGVLSGEAGERALAPFTEGLFKGMLCLFLLDMGLVSARRLGSARALGLFPAAFGIGAPLVHAAIAIPLARLLGLGPGDAFLFTALVASASYIAVPAAMRLAIPEANPGLYVTMALAITFPFNVVLGLPLYLSVILALWR